MNDARFRERGVAAIEMTVVLSLGMVILATIVLFGRFTWHLIAMEKSVYNAARIIVALPIEQVSGTGAFARMPAVGNDLVLAAARSSGTDIVPEDGAVTVLCNGSACGTVNLTRVTVNMRTTFTDTVFGDAYTFGLLPIGEGTDLVFETGLDYAL
jgi:Flp pilus assembly protein TadG